MFGNICKFAIINCKVEIWKKIKKIINSNNLKTSKIKRKEEEKLKFNFLQLLIANLNMSLDMRFKNVCYKLSVSLTLIFYKHVLYHLVSSSSGVRFFEPL